MENAEMERHLSELTAEINRGFGLLHEKLGVAASTGKFSAKRSASIAELSKALAKAQGEIKFAVADSMNPFLGSKYADLASVWDACREPLSANGLAVIQTVDSDDPQIARVTTLLSHSSGEWIETTLSCRVPDAVTKDGGGYKITPVQLLGATLTYLRRFSLAPIVGVSPVGEDNDGTAGQEGGKGKEDEKITEQQITNLTNLAAANKHDIPAFCGYWKIKELKELPLKHYQLAVNMLRKKAPLAGDPPATKA